MCCTPLATAFPSSTTARGRPLPPPSASQRPAPRRPAKVQGQYTGSPGKVPCKCTGNPVRCQNKGNGQRTRVLLSKPRARSRFAASRMLICIEERRLKPSSMTDDGTLPSRFTATPKPADAMPVYFWIRKSRYAGMSLCRSLMSSNTCMRRPGSVFKDPGFKPLSKKGVRIPRWEFRDTGLGLPDLVHDAVQGVVEDFKVEHGVRRSLRLAST
eukprot:3113750-Rhodomonas_salina.2